MEIEYVNADDVITFFLYLMIINQYFSYLTVVGCYFRLFIITG